MVIVGVDGSSLQMDSKAKMVDFCEGWWRLDVESAFMNRTE